MPARPDSEDPAKPRYLDPSALATPALAISCAAREALRISDVIEEMLTGMLTVLKTNDRALAERLRKLDDVVDELYTAVKLYLTQISREALEEKEGRRWADIVSFTINMEQIGDIIERIIIDVVDKKIDKGRNFSEAGMGEICDLHARLIANLKLGQSVFLNGDLKSAQELLAQKVLVRELERAYADSHLARLAGNAQDSIETSSLHLDLIADLRRINSHICSIAYPILDQAGVLAKTRLKDPEEAAANGAPRRGGRRGAGDEPAARQERLPEAQAAHGIARARLMPATELTLGVTLAVLAAALLHAGWNALLKAAPGGDPLLDMASVVAGSSLTGLVVAPFVGLPDAAAWKFAAASTVIHFGYYVTLSQAYRTGDLSFAYPLMRGTAPLLVTVLGVIFLRRVAVSPGRGRHRADLARHRQHRAGSAQPPPAGGGSVGADQRADHRDLHTDRRRGGARVEQSRELRRLADDPRRLFRFSGGYSCGAARPRSRTCGAVGGAGLPAAPRASPPTASCSGR